MLRPNELAWYYILLDFSLEDVIDFAPLEYSGLMMNAMSTSDADPTSPYVYDLLETMLRMAPSNQLWQEVFNRIPQSNSIRYFECL